MRRRLQYGMIWGVNSEATEGQRASQSRNGRSGHAGCCCSGRGTHVIRRGVISRHHGLPAFAPNSFEPSPRSAKRLLVPDVPLAIAVGRTDWPTRTACRLSSRRRTTCASPQSEFHWQGLVANGAIPNRFLFSSFSVSSNVLRRNLGSLWTRNNRLLLGFSTLIISHLFATMASVPKFCDRHRFAGSYGSWGMSAAGGFIPSGCGGSFDSQVGARSGRFGIGVRTPNRKVCPQFLDSQWYRLRLEKDFGLSRPMLSASMISGQIDEVVVEFVRITNSISYAPAGRIMASNCHGRLIAISGDGSLNYLFHGSSLGKKVRGRSWFIS